MENRIPKAMHPTTGELRAFLDGEVAPDRSSVIRDHLAGCSRCRTLGRHLREDESVVRDALTKMTGEPDLARARRELRRRLTSGDVEPRRAGDLPVGGRTDPGGGADPARPTTREARAAPGWSEHLRTAALLLLLLGGITAALPGSPVRAWLLDVWGGDGNAPSAPVAEDEATEAPTPPGPEPREEATVRVDPSEGTVRIDLIGVEDGTPVRIRLVEGGRAGVSALGAGAFRTGAGFLGVRDPGDSVTVEIPRGVQVAEIRADDRILLRKTGDSVDFPTATPQADGDAFVITIPGVFQDGDG